MLHSHDFMIKIVVFLSCSRRFNKRLQCVPLCNRFNGEFAEEIDGERAMLIKVLSGENIRYKDTGK